MLYLGVPLNESYRQWPLSRLESKATDEMNDG
jgi:hypothetical protein